MTNKKLVFALLAAIIIFSGYKNDDDNIPSYTVDFEPLYNNNNKDFSNALSAAIDQGMSDAATEIAQNKPYKIIVDIKQAEYTFTSTINLKSVNNVEINGNGSKFIYTKDISAFVLEECSGVSLNNITVDYNPLLFTQGMITKLDGDHIEFQVDAGYSDDMDFYFNNGANSANVIDSETGAMKANTRDWFSVQSFTGINHNTFSLNIGWDINGRMAQSQYMVKVGDLIAIKKSIGHAVTFYWCKNISVTNFTMNGAGGFAFLEMYGDGGHYYNNVKITPGPKPAGATRERLFSTNADVIHSASVKVGPTIENCLFEKQGDDGVNVHGYYGFAVQKVDAKTWLICPKYADIIQPDDELEINDGGSYETKKFTTAVSVKKVERNDLESLSIKAWEGKHPPQSYTALLEVTFSDAVEMELGDAVSSITRNSSGAVIRNSTFRGNRSRAIVAKTFDVLIEGNTIENTGLSGIVCSSEIGYWGEAHFSRNIIIRNNTLTGCNTSVMTRTDYSEEIGAINVSLFGPLDFKGMYESQPNKNIIIENNTIIDGYAYGIFLSNINGVSVTGNEIANSWRQGPEDGGKKFGIMNVASHIYIACSSNAYFCNNSFTNNQYITNGLQYDKCEELEVCIPSVTATEDIKNTSSTTIRIFPNPANNVIHVELSTAANGTLALYDMSGETVLYQSINGDNAVLNIGSLPSGNYILRLLHNGKASAGVKLVKL